MMISKTNEQYIAHVVPEYLGHTMNWIYTQIKYQQAYKSYVLTQKSLNQESYPVDMIFTSRNASYSLRKPSLLERFQRRLGRLPFEERKVFTKALAKYPPIAIQAHFGWDSYFSLCLKRDLGLPLISRFYGYDIGVLPKIPLWEKRYADLFLGADMFLVEGNYMKRSLTLLGCPENRIKVHRLGIEVDSIPYSNDKFIHDEIRILMAASFKPKKGLEYGLSAIAQARKLLPTKHFVVTIIGDGDLREYLKMLAVKYKLDDVIKWEGYKSHEFFVAALANADIYLSPSITSEDGDTEGGAPVAIIEAGAAGVPVVSTFHADIPEVVLDGVSGLLSREKNVGDLANSICKLANNKDFAIKLGENARDHIASNYSAIKQGKELEDIYSRFSH